MLASYLQNYFVLGTYVCPFPLFNSALYGRRKCERKWWFKTSSLLLEHRKCETFFECLIDKFSKDIVYNGERYVTKPPFRHDHNLLPDNFRTCEKNIKWIYLDIQIIGRVPEKKVCKAPGEVNYLLQLLVAREKKETAKIKAAFDASCSTTGPSIPVLI